MNRLKNVAEASATRNTQSHTAGVPCSVCGCTIFTYFTNVLYTKIINYYIHDIRKFNHWYFGHRRANVHLTKFSYTAMEFDDELTFYIHEFETKGISARKCIIFT